MDIVMYNNLGTRANSMIISMTTVLTSTALTYVNFSRG